VVAAMPVADLTTRVIADLRESEALALTVLALAPSPPVLHDLASGFHFGVEHLDEHIAQIRANLVAARSA
jgi:hypothetical protein